MLMLMLMLGVALHPYLMGSLKSLEDNLNKDRRKCHQTGHHRTGEAHFDIRDGTDGNTQADRNEAERQSSGKMIARDRGIRIVSLQESNGWEEP